MHTLAKNHIVCPLPIACAVNLRKSFSGCHFSDHCFVAGSPLPADGDGLVAAINTPGLSNTGGSCPALATATA